MNSIRFQESRSGNFVKPLRGVYGITDYPNIEAEILVPRMLRMSNLPGLEVRPLINDELYAVEMPRLPPSHSSGWELAAKRLDLLQSIQTDSLVRLLAVDLLIGNADRSTSNLLVRLQGSHVDLFPIDHNLAFVGTTIQCDDPAYLGFVEDFNGLSGHCQSNYKKWFWSRCGTVEHIIHSTPAYCRFSRFYISHRFGDQLLQACKGLCKEVTNDWIENEIDSLPDTIFPFNPIERKNELKRVLSSRATKLVPAMHQYLRGVSADNADRNLSRF